MLTPLGYMAVVSTVSAGLRCLGGDAFGL